MGPGEGLQESTLKLKKALRVFKGGKDSPNQKAKILQNAKALDKFLEHVGPQFEYLKCQDANSESELSLYSLSVLDKENSLESSLHWSTYLYIIYLVCALSIPHSQPNHV